MNETTETNFQDAFAAEMGGTPAPPDTTPPVAPAPDPVEAEPVVPPAAEPPAEVPPADEPKTPVEDEPKTPEVPAGEPKVETAEEKANREAAEAVEESKPATKEDIAAAIREYNQETTGRVEKVDQARKEIISKLHPEGIDTTIYDTNGNAIKTAQDIVDRGITKDNGEPYTYEEAASFMLEAGKKMAENIEELENWAGEVAEKNISLMEGNQRVMAKWGETLKTLSKETVKMIADTYMNKQLTFDKEGNYVTDMRMTPEEFYDTVMAPYSEFNATVRAQEEAEADRKAAEETAAKQAEQQERSGIPPQRGTSEVKSNTGNPMLDALVDEMKKG